MTATNLTATNLTANEKFLAAWEAAGKPPVRKLGYGPGGRDKTLYGHDEVRSWAKTEGAEFSDNGEDVKLSWTYTSEAFDTAGSWSAELYFDRANLIARPGQAKA